MVTFHRHRNQGLGGGGGGGMASTKVFKHPPDLTVRPWPKSKSLRKKEIKKKKVTMTLRGTRTGTGGTVRVPPPPQVFSLCHIHSICPVLQVFIKSCAPPPPPPPTQSKISLSSTSATKWWCSCNHIHYNHITADGNKLEAVYARGIYIFPGPSTTDLAKIYACTH